MIVLALFLSVPTTKNHLHEGLAELHSFFETLLELMMHMARGGRLKTYF